MPYIFFTDALKVAEVQVAYHHSSPVQVYFLKGPQIHGEMGQDKYFKSKSILWTITKLKMRSLDHLLISDNFLHPSLCDFLCAPALPELKGHFHSILPQFLY